MSQPPLKSAPNLPPAGMPSPEEFQRMVYLYQMLEEQQDILTDQRQMIQQQIMGANLSKTTMEGLRGLQTDHEIVVPMGTYAFTKARLLDPNKIMVSVSKEIIIEKTLDDAIKSMENLLANYESIHSRITGQLNDVQEKMAQLKPQIEEIYQATQGSRGPN
jgi:prefoldin alpha subunit